MYETVAPRVSDRPLPIRLIGEISFVPPVAMIHVDLLLNFGSESAVVDPNAYPQSDRIKNVRKHYSLELPELLGFGQFSTQTATNSLATIRLDIYVHGSQHTQNTI
ncbi:hypothetical protein QTP88_009011 [Uroleucon formosanum]